MHPQGTGDPAYPDADLRLDSGGSAEALTTRPFVERRRVRSSEPVWHEALESVHKLLVRFEETNELLIEAEESFRGIFENALIGIFRMGPDGELKIVNRSMARICGYESAGQMLAEVPNLREQMFGDRSQWSDLVRMVQSKGFQCGFEAELNLHDGSKRWLELSLRAVRDGNRVSYYEGTAQDVTERKRDEERIRLLAYYDVITGLPNRRLFEERLTEALTAARWKSQRVALIVLELGRFKMINDSLGKSFGDRLLQAVADRIRATVGEHTTVARISGAEFAIVLQDLRAVREVEQIAELVIAAVTGEFSFAGHQIIITCTLGISLFPLDGKDGQMLLERADVALYSTKEQGANGFQFFTEEMNNRIRTRLKLENGLRLALDRDELFLMYQPQVDIRTGGVSGLEALLRWQHPELGLVPPGEFIGVAESTGLIVPIGEWVLRTACLQARKWQDAGLRAVPVAVNVSAIQFRQKGFCGLVRSVLEETGLNPEYLELELTEGMLLSNVDVMFMLMQELREMGVKLAIDDFGTGYSSLGYLRQFKVNRLKIDRSFVREISVNADDAAITTAIINMAKALNLDVLAEGVENAEQLDFLRALNCFSIQGFYFGKPMAVDKIEEQLQEDFLHTAQASA